MDDPAILILLIFLAIFIWGVQASRHQRRVRAAVTLVKALSPLMITTPGETRFRTLGIGIGEKATGWRSCLLAVLEDRLLVYPDVRRMDEHQTFPVSALRWFGRPVKYIPGVNEMWLHFEMDGRWQILKVRLWRADMMQLVRSLKAIATDEQVTAYRRRRPYIHHGPVVAQPASQDIHGAWTLEAPVELYLMPLFLVIMRGGVVLRRLELAKIQQIGALKRLDAPDADGLVRFQMEGEPFAFALADHNLFAQGLAEAAKRTLEDPIVRKGKPKDDEEAELEEDSEDDLAYQDLNFSDFYIGDDGEIHRRR